MKYLFLITIIVVSLISCDNTGFKPDATGRPGELVVVIEDVYLQNESGAAIRDVFGKMQYGLPQEEPIFTIVTIPKSAFGQVLQRHRNILVADISKNHPKPTLTLNNDVHANGQLYIQVSAPNDSAFANILLKNRDALAGYFTEKELERLSAASKKNSDKATLQYIGQKHLVSLHLPKTYNLVHEAEDFSWFRYQTEKPSGGQRHSISRNLLVFNRDYNDMDMLKLGNIMDAQDSVTRKFVPGPTEGSYMKIVEELLPAKKEFNLNGSYAVELRGLWHVEKDFMGGPFVNYTTVDTFHNQVVTLVSFVYAPNFDKREYLREMEGIMRTLEPLQK